MFERVIFNTGGASIRLDTMEGKEYLVVPTVMITEGVWEGSGGKLYYPGDELAKTPAVWNHKPIVIDHPTVNGQGISACSPEVLTTRKVGLIMNAGWDAEGQLRSESWIEKDRLRAVDKRVLERLEKGEVVEVSTGLFTDNEAKPGEWNGKKYDAIARNYRPDHLAILPDSVGACSVADGAGLLQLNEASYSKISNWVNRLLSAKYGKPGQYWNGYVIDIYSDFVIFCDEDGGMYKIGYTATDTEATLSGSAVQVVRVTEYRTADGKVVGNSRSKLVTMEEIAMAEKKEKVDALIKNGGWTEEDRVFLMEMTDARLDRMIPLPTPPAPTVPAVTNTAPAVLAIPVVTNTVAVPEVPKAVTLDQYVANAPTELRGVLLDGIASHAAEKARLVGTITANKGNQFTKEFLESQGIQILRGIASLAAIPAEQPQILQPSWFGAATPIGNNGQALPVEPLPLPVMNFGK